MGYLNMKFVTSAANPGGFVKDNKPQVVITGKSNVGKSSLVNCISNNKKMAKVSSTPGKTRLINYFDVDGGFYITDLPGYGFAKVSKDMKASWEKLMNQYFGQDLGFKQAVHLVDIRHESTGEDRMMREYLLSYGYNVITVATKADKLSRMRVNQSVAALRKTLMLSAEELLIPFSSETCQGRDILVSEILKAVSAV